MQNQSMFLGRWYKDGDIICRQGELGDCMYILQQGQVELMGRDGSREYCLTVLQEGQFWGEGALIERDHRRTATARAIGSVCVLTVEKRMFLSRMHEDPSFVLKIMQNMLRRIHELEGALVRVAGSTQVQEAPGAAANAVGQGTK
jgi:CRP-like cAMP-binding protein